ncbi:MAG: DNA gyrase/topoisomerase IV subunit B [Brevibacterium aurantiacum]|uniref:DNA topoisomerase (ATP-hydrolyzing) n=1 Tax=Brevibacterium aurantiacum TaxID=273384 RepID=A0A1D7W4Q3_BREAU|nr:MULTISPECIES: DNA topoisomerase IV subunit B [Brevibacterium]AOP54029.1 Topoisomerase IV subunit B [Brevibacterium aurantiacum]AZL06121.1 type IIA DNA topoisomerase subunit B [Brevibacterium aurantiacum]AZL13316.1 type IIA DNA topoisomerase subunit B [Brevibacterium aurantiacum]AZT93810.1 type IIA DNA topoisomerase subunit B [Brevibacterium aurantiacum]AZT97601.1 type IIA DNA topoisomerase subunit B [Brevibacterium aurantiacum]
MEEESYGARHLSVLSGLEAVRKRPGMYIGTTDSRGLMHCLWEIIDNAVDEALGGFGKSILIELEPDGSVAVTDSGRGIPVDIEPKTGLTGVEVVLTKLHAGGKFGGSSYAASGGLHGVGASVVNALSARLDVEVTRGSKVHKMSFRRGVPGRFDDSSGQPGPDNPFEEFHEPTGLDVVRKAKKGVTGTRVQYWADPQIFLSKAQFDYQHLVERARQTAFLVPGLELRIEDRRGVARDETGEVIAERLEVFRFDGGITEFVDHLSIDPPMTDTWRLQDTGKFSETVPVLDSSGHLVSKEVEREVGVDIALRWGTGYDTKVKSFVNVVSTPHGGTHLSGFEQASLKAMRKAVEANARKLKLGKDKLEKDDVLAGLTAVVTVQLAEPQFEGQTKEVLGTAAVRQIVAKTVERQLGDILSSTKRAEKQQAAVLMEKVVAELKSRISARTHKENQRRKTALEASSLPAKLYDCRDNGVENTELFIVEGDSAMGTAKAARNSDHQALFPIRGKILNVQKASLSDMLANVECAALIQVIGAGSGRSFDIDAARYGRVIIMTDADVDGAHIRTLLLTLFFRYMKPLVEQGRVFAAVPPLHRVEVVTKRGTPNDVIYTYSEAELQALLKKLEKSKKTYKEPIQRYKGLGEMDADQLAETTMDPSMRTLRRVTMADAEAAENTFELLMGSSVGPRKEFIVSGAAVLDAERIDS